MSSTNLLNAQHQAKLCSRTDIFPYSLMWSTTFIKLQKERDKEEMIYLLDSLSKEDPQIKKRGTHFYQS